MNAPASSTRSSPTAGLISRLRQAWQSISPRERRLVLIAGGVVLLGLVVSLLDWSRSERGRLTRSLPRAEAQLEQVQEAATELTRLRGQTAPQRAAGPALLEAAQVSAKSRGLGLALQATGDGLQIKGQASLDAFVDWLAMLQRDQGLRVQRLEVQGQGATASIDAVLVKSD
ncbi:MAG: type II secretion system protein GspM [Zoogloea sp.]|uniref:type II secretion system protein GspM n=1 Tax=Zoogloea sp. TaxID=49181 RepID=UPI002623F5F2|nr:type II secretion system protein GspM [Zoogloea sp.]MDD3326386.1 type II secretion system protein GspM [Zoogloea sp.]